MMQIGPYKLSSNLVLAPMAGVSDKPFRQLCRRFGAGLTVSEMISADTSLWRSHKTLTRLNHEGEEAPISVQILGSDPQEMAQAARINADYGAQIIDINMGCPAKKVCRMAAGSALLRDESRVARILETVVNAVEIPVTLKIRTGWDTDNRNGVQIAHIAEQSGIQALVVHGRTRACGFSGEAEFDTVRQINAAVKLPIIANGDIDHSKKAKQVLKSTGVDGIMIGRAAQGRPWIFAEIDHYLQTGEQLPEPKPSWVRNILLEHLDALYSLYGKAHGIRIARKHIAWYSKHREGGTEFRKAINQVTTTEDQTKLIHGFFDCRRLGEELAA